jgi:hypothetical protein
LRKIPLLLLLVPTMVFADEVYLKGGAKFSGRIEEQTATMVTINIGDGVVGVAMSRVDRIVKGRSPLDEYDEKAHKLGPQDVEGWKSLGRWASHHGLSAQSREAYRKALVSTPDDAEARQALGYVKLEGRWLTEEESYQARGYVKHDGEWMTKDEAQRAEAATAAQQAAHDAAREANIAQAEAILAETRGQKAQERAEREARDMDFWDMQDQMLSWGGWGYGTTSWPTATNVVAMPGYSVQPPPAASTPK